MPNRLAGESSPYLLQHRDNPVDWLPWGPDAFERAKAESKPVFLSVGYSSCHWCHVMAHESFEDLEVASVLNRSFISVKVDREERPDVDEAYMTAVQLQSGRGGWPMSAFLTPNREPFFAGTYFPKASFLSLLRQVEGAWQGQRAQVEASAREFREAVESALARPAPMATHALSLQLLAGAVQALHHEFDEDHGGFGEAPKFPPHAALAFLLDFAEAEGVDPAERSEARRMAELTLAKMCLGGIHDHVGGGFHRYSTDAIWLLPHFEKMLYDNALMLGNLVRASRFKGPWSGLFDRAAKGIVRWLGETMRTADGLLGTAVDADSEGEEGKYTVWTVDEVRAVLGERAEAFLAAYRFDPEGNFRDEAAGHRTGANIPHLAEDDGDRFAKDLAAMRAVRRRRVPPLFDHKALVGLNGMAAGALAEAGERPMAEEIFAALDRFIPAGGPIPRQITEGRVSGQGFLEDYVGLLEVWCALGKGDLDAFDARFGPGAAFRDVRAGDYYETTENHERLFGRTKPVFDHPIPSGNARMAKALARMGEVAEARRIVEANLGWVERAPSSTAGLLQAGLAVLGG